MAPRITDNLRKNKSVAWGKILIKSLSVLLISKMEHYRCMGSKTCGFYYVKLGCPTKCSQNLLLIGW